MQNQQVNLPFNPFGLQYQPMNFTQDAPPIVPNLQDINPKFAYILRNVCSELVNEVTRKAGSNTLRTFHFNQVYHNGFNNADYFQMVQSAMDMIELMLVSGQAQTPEHAMQVVIPQATLYSCVLNLQNPMFRNSLVGIINPAQVHEANGLIPQIATIQNSIMSYKQSMNNTMQQPAFINHTQQQYGNQSWQQNNQYGNPAPSNMRFPSAAVPVNNGHMQQAVQRTYSQKPFNNNQQQFQQSEIVEDSKYAYLNKAKAVQVAVSQPQQVFTNVNPDVDEYGFDIVTKWIPSEEFPYPPAVNKKEILRSKTVKKKKTLQNGDVVEYVMTEMIVQPRSIEQMNREDHQVTTAQMAATPYIPPQFSTREEMVNSALSNVVSQANKESENLNAQVDTNQEWSAVMFLDKIILDNKVMQKANIITGKGLSYRSYHVLAKPFISSRNNQDVIEHLNQAATIPELAKKMQNLVSTSAEKAVVDFAYELDQYLTVEFCKYLSGKFSIYIKRLDSFMDDCVDIYDFVLSQGSEAHLQAFKRDEKNFVKAYVSCVEGQLAEDLKNECEIADSEGKPIVHATLVENCYSVTSIDMHSTEISIDFYKSSKDEGKGRGSLIRQSSNPFLFKFAKDLIEEVKEQLGTFTHHLLITSDGKLFEIHAGVVGYQENYLISEFPY